MIAAVPLYRECSWRWFRRLGADQKVRRMFCLLLFLLIQVWISQSRKLCSYSAILLTFSKCGCRLSVVCQELYQRYLIFMAFLKFDLMFTIINTLISDRGIFNRGLPLAFDILNIAAIALFFVFGWLGVCVVVPVLSLSSIVIVVNFH